MAPPVDLPSAHVSYTQWIWFGVQALPVRSELAAPVTSTLLFLSFAKDVTASAAAELLSWVMTFTPLVSIQSRAMLVATSGLL